MATIVNVRNLVCAGKFWSFDPKLPNLPPYRAGDIIYYDWLLHVIAKFVYPDPSRGQHELRCATI